MQQSFFRFSLEMRDCILTIYMHSANLEMFSATNHVTLSIIYAVNNLVITTNLFSYLATECLPRLQTRG